MRGVPADQLSPAQRRQIEERTGHAIPGGRKRPRLSRAGMGDAQPSPGTCSCGERFHSMASWEKHAKPTGCTRYALDLDGGAA